MILLLAFAFLAGVVTVLSPCILPVLPVVLASALSSGRWRPLGVVVGLVMSFAFFTLALSTLVSLLGIPADALRLGGAMVIGLFGLAMLLPPVLQRFELLSGRLAALGGAVPAGNGFWGGAVVGGSLGLVWAPCAGPILAAVTTLAATNRLSLQAAAITLGYGIGAGLPMLLIAYGGRRVVSRVRLLNHHTGALQRAFGVVMVAFAFTFFVGIDRTVQAWLLQSVPPEWTTALTSLEDRKEVRDALDDLKDKRNASGAAAAPVAGSQAESPTGLGSGSTTDLRDFGPAPELEGIAGWVNGEPVTIASLRGKVVLVDFWTYSCINCIRTLPYLNRWHERYSDAGLVIVGVHTPEFEFEKSRDNVARAVQQYGIRYLVAQDNGFATWEAYENRYWPAKYLVDARGRIRYVHFGEGKYEETERAIRDLLREAGASTLADDPATQGYSLATGRTPELYLGAARQSHLTSQETFRVGEPQRFSVPGSLPLHRFAFEGDWVVEKEHAVASKGSSLQLEFLARDVYIVLAPGSNGEEVDVLLDGRPVAVGDGGADVRGASLAASEQGLYHLVHLDEPGRHRLSLRFHNGGTGVYTFTFG